MTLTEKLLALAATLEEAGGDLTVAALHEAVAEIDNLNDALGEVEAERDELRSELDELRTDQSRISQSDGTVVRALTALFDNLPTEILRESVQQHERRARGRQITYSQFAYSQMNITPSFNAKDAYKLLGVS